MVTGPLLDAYFTDIFSHSRDYLSQLLDGVL